MPNGNVYIYETKYQSVQRDKRTRVIRKRTHRLFVAKTKHKTTNKTKWFNSKAKKRLVGILLKNRLNYRSVPGSFAEFQTKMRERAIKTNRRFKNREITVRVLQFKRVPARSRRKLPKPRPRPKRFRLPKIFRPKRRPRRRRPRRSR